MTHVMSVKGSEVGMCANMMVGSGDPLRGILSRLDRHPVVGVCVRHGRSTWLIQHCAGARKGSRSSGRSVAWAAASKSILSAGLYPAWQWRVAWPWHHNRRLNAVSGAGTCASKAKRLNQICQRCGGCLRGMSARSLFCAVTHV